jgi:diphosphomevalonate decarboxylase
MNNNPFGQSRISQAKNNFKDLINVLKSGDLDYFVRIAENEALTLHAMMMTSKPSFILMKPNTISVIERIWEYRKETNIPVCFTLDAGPNIHLLYPHENRNNVGELIESLSSFTTEQPIMDYMGDGPEKINL